MLINSDEFELDVSHGNHINFGSKISGQIFKRWGNIGVNEKPRLASNFKIFAFRTNDTLYLQLAGDFDGSSAHELINTLTKLGTDYWDIYVDTNSLNSIHPFGRDVFQKNLSGIKKQLNNLIIFGVNKI
jgi:anti-anti-sigma regulatory factor